MSRAIDLIDKLIRESEAAEKVISIAREWSMNYTRGMRDDDPMKGVGNRMADALAELDASHDATSQPSQEKP